MVLAHVKKLGSQAPLGASLVVFSSLFFASYGIWTKLIGSVLGGYTASAIRSLLVLIMLAPITWSLRKLQPLNLKQNRYQMLGLVISSLFIWGPLYYAILHAGVGISLTINYAAIVIGMFVFGSLFAGEAYSLDKLFSTVLGLAGLWLIFAPNLSGIGWVALAAAVVSGLSCGLNSVSAKLLRYNATQSTLVVWVVGTIANIFMALAVGEHLPASGLGTKWVWLLCFAAASVLSTWSLVRGLKLIDAGAAGVLGLLEIVFGVLFGVILFGEHIGPIVGLGIVLIVVAAAVPYVKEYRTGQIAGG